MKKTLLLLVLFSLSLQARIIYVNQQNRVKDANGSSWPSAYTNLNKALKTAKRGDEIWVAKGEYILKPIRLQGISIYGGFSATERELSQRQIVNNETKLYGRLALQNSFLSSVTILQKPENTRAVELHFAKKKNSLGFRPDKKLMQEHRRQRERLNMMEETEAHRDESRDFQRKAPPPAEQIMQRFDLDKDGAISKEEAPGKMRLNWDRLDRNGDGYVEEKELRPPRPRKEFQREE